MITVDACPAFNFRIVFEDQGCQGILIDGCDHPENLFNPFLIHQLFGQSMSSPMSDETESIQFGQQWTNCHRTSAGVYTEEEVGSPIRDKIYCIFDVGG